MSWAIVILVGNGLKPFPTDSVKPYGLSEIVRALKTFSSRRINERLNAAKNFHWQKSFYDHVIRNDRTLENIRKYIQNNPLRWDSDWENKPLGCEDKAGLKKYYDDILNGV